MTSDGSAPTRMFTSSIEFASMLVNSPTVRSSATTCPEPILCPQNDTPEAIADVALVNPATPTNANTATVRFMQSSRDRDGPSVSQIRFNSCRVSPAQPAIFQELVNRA